MALMQQLPGLMTGLLARSGKIIGWSAAGVAGGAAIGAATNEADGTGGITAKTTRAVAQPAIIETSALQGLDALWDMTAGAKANVAAFFSGTLGTLFEYIHDLTGWQWAGSVAKTLQTSHAGQVEKIAELRDNSRRAAAGDGFAKTVGESVENIGHNLTGSDNTAVNMTAGVVAGVGGGLATGWIGSKLANGIKNWFGGGNGPDAPKGNGSNPRTPNGGGTPPPEMKLEQNSGGEKPRNSRGQFISEAEAAKREKIEARRAATANPAGGATRVATEAADDVAKAASQAKMPGGRLGLLVGGTTAVVGGSLLYSSYAADAAEHTPDNQVGSTDLKGTALERFAESSIDFAKSSTENFDGVRATGIGMNGIYEGLIDGISTIGYLPDAFNWAANKVGYGVEKPTLGSESIHEGLTNLYNAYVNGAEHLLGQESSLRAEPQNLAESAIGLAGNMAGQFMAAGGITKGLQATKQAAVTTNHVVTGQMTGDAFKGLRLDPLAP